ncbi:MAG: bacteriohemerythrin [Spirochaetota bacterium]
MDVIHWKAVYNTGDETIDRHHRELVRMIHQLQLSRDKCLDKAETDRLFDRLLEYAREHFSYEESLMERIDFPFINSHRKDHEFFRDTITRWQNDDEIACKSQKISLFLTEWLYEHILHYDIKIRDYMDQNTSKPV